jgi:hypothetical protein
MAEAQAAAAIPASVNVGDTLDIRVPLLTNSCSNFTAIRAVVRVVGTRGVWLDDVGNPAAGLTTSDFQSLSTRFDNQIYAVNTDWFGQPSDFDGNARAVIVVTKEVNKQENVLGFVAAADMFPRATCESSDFGEIYYGRSADPSGTFGDEYSVENTRLDAVQLIGHEFTHIIQFGRRIQDPADPEVQTVWELEGQAVLAEEINGHAATGRTGGQNYGFGVAYCGLSSQADPCDIPHYADAFIDLAIYFGLSIDDNNTPFRIQNAPEQCSWLGRRTQENNTGPCLSGREVYGTPWSFLRWLTDNFGASTPGGGQALHRALVDDNSSGFQTIANVTGTPQINLLLAQWAATLWLDDRETGMQDRLTMSSWNLRSVFQATFSGVPSGLQPRERSFSAFNDAVSVRGGSSAYYTIGGANRPATFIGFRRQDGSQLPNGMQVWVVRTR